MKRERFDAYSMDMALYFIQYFKFFLSMFDDFVSYIEY